MKKLITVSYFSYILLLDWHFLDNPMDFINTVKKAHRKELKDKNTHCLGFKWALVSGT